MSYSSWTNIVIRDQYFIADWDILVSRTTRMETLLTGIGSMVIMKDNTRTDFGLVGCVG